MPVLITGGAGYIGSHTAKAFAQAGIEPVVLDDLSRGYRNTVRWGPLIEADIADQSALDRVFQDYSIAAVIHFAGFISVGESMLLPELYFENIFGNTLSLLQAMHRANVLRLVFSSTAAVYGNPHTIPVAEDHAKNPVSPYGEAKLMVERLLHWYGVCHGFSYAPLRYFNAAGADPEGELGENHDPETHLIPLAISAALGETERLAIYGKDYDTPDGTAIRDFLHVTDLASAHLAALRYLETGGSSTAFNLGTGRGYSVREVMAMVERVSGRPVPVLEADRRAGDPPRLIADATKAARLLQWHPRHSELEEIVRTAWSWKTRPAAQGSQASR